MWWLIVQVAAAGDRHDTIVPYARPTDGPWSICLVLPPGDDDTDLVMDDGPSTVTCKVRDQSRLCVTFIEDAPWVVVLFKKMRDDRSERISDQVYYVNESVGIAAGLFIAAIHQAGLATLTHTPSPMQFLTTILRRPDYERPYLLLPVGYPADGCQVPDIQRRPLGEVLVFDR